MPDGKPSDSTLYVSQDKSGTLLEKSVPEETPILEPAGGRSDWWGKMPHSILTDNRLEHIDRTVFGIIALGHDSRSPRPITIGVRRIAEEIKETRMAVSRSIGRLINTGHIVRLKVLRGQRAWYQLTAHAFLKFEDFGDGVEMVTGTSGVPKYCGKTVPPLSVPVRSLPRRLKESA